MRSQQLIRSLIPALSIVFLCAIALTLISRTTLRNPLSQASHESPTSIGIFPDPTLDIPASNSGQKQTIVLAGGCFWGVEAVFEQLKGVSQVVSGYSGGSAETANYSQVSLGKTPHAESVGITYDPTQISYGQLLKVYFAVAHDPTQLNQQYPDRGTQYRSAIFFATDKQKQVAQAYIEQLNQAQSFRKPIVTQVVPLEKFYAAETDHQNFVKHNPNYPYVVVHDLPKLKRLEKRFPNLYRDQLKLSTTSQ
ncbi:peptide-methionine (S)-S-oxide reductase MsrA [Leptolyngbya sp. AN03gr2]|uniref:peptide-methionine (S)-S-oxide reductase MsrA n=1 Tax=unclassified Leptolyngbya TaxID=2650499 RepID=UPI003D318AEC